MDQLNNVDPLTNSTTIPFDFNVVEDRNKDDDIQATSSTLSLKCPVSDERNGNPSLVEGISPSSDLVPLIVCCSFYSVVFIAWIPAHQDSYSLIALPPLAMF
jgi:hypothetical protein